MSDGGIDEKANFMSDVSETLRCFKSTDISIGKDKLEEFMHVNDENKQAILGDVNEVLETMQTMTLAQTTIVHLSKTA